MITITVVISRGVEFGKDSYSMLVYCLHLETIPSSGITHLVSDVLDWSSLEMLFVLDRNVGTNSCMLTSYQRYIDFC